MNFFRIKTITDCANSDEFWTGFCWAHNPCHAKRFETKTQAKLSVSAIKRNSSYKKSVNYGVREIKSLEIQHVFLGQLVLGFVRDVVRPEGSYAIKWSI